ncbi:MAG: hypothetical protein ACE5OT_02320 [Candidatus Hadarchaeaceae archaeon]
MKKDIMPKKGRTTRKSKHIKRRLQITERELRHLKSTQRLYVGKMLKFGLAAWVFGLSVFFFMIVMVNAKLFGPPPVWISLLVGVPAAPVTITAVFIRKFAVKTKHLERIRHRLLAKYKKVTLQPVRLKIMRELEELSGEEFLRRTGALKQQLQANERELRRLRETQRLYVKKMLKFGFAAWVFGLSVFFFAIVIVNVELIGPLPVWTSLLVGVPAAPVTITAVFVRKYSVKIKRLESARRELLAKKYKKTRSRHVKRMKASKK